MSAELMECEDEEEEPMSISMSIPVEEGMALEAVDVAIVIVMWSMVVGSSRLTDF